MNLFKNIRLKRGEAILRKKVQNIKRNKFRGNLASVKKIGIVWDVASVGDFEHLSQFNQKMNERGIDVKVIGYYPGKLLPDRLTAIRFLWCLKKSDLNFFFIPLSEEAELFTSTPFDVLIDMNFNNVFPLKYISAMSSASLKVGLFNKGTCTEYYDLMFEIKKPVNAGDYLSNIIHYLELINNTTNIINH